MALAAALILVVAIFGFAIFGFKRFDSMLYRIYDTDKQRWKALGQPVGFFWVPKDKTPFFRSTNARNAMFFDFIAAGLKEPNKSLQPTPVDRGG